VTCLPPTTYCTHLQLTYRLRAVPPASPRSQHLWQNRRVNGAGWDAARRACYCAALSPNWDSRDIMVCCRDVLGVLRHGRAAAYTTLAYFRVVAHRRICYPSAYRHGGGRGDDG